MPGDPVILDSLGGLVSTARPEDIPEGASPRTYDTDFIVGRVIQRAGLQNVYSYSGATYGPNGGSVATSISTEGNPWSNPANVLTNDGTYTTSSPVSPLITDVIEVSGFNLTLPSMTPVLGIAVDVYGFASGATIYAQLLNNGVAVGNIYSATMPTSEGSVTLGTGSTDLWGSTWDYTNVDSTQFKVHLWAVVTSPATVAINYATVTIYSNDGQTDFLGLSTTNLNQSDTTTLALDSSGLVWQEDASNNPGVLSRASLIPAVIPGSYMKGIDANGTAYMAYSNLTQGSSQPMQYTGSWCDRITQVGPGTSPVFTPQQASTDTYTISTITQPSQKSNGYSYFLQSSGPGSTDAGTCVTIYYNDSGVSSGDADLIAAFNSGYAVYLYMEFTGSGIPTQGPYAVQVTAVGLAQPPGQPRKFYYFTYNVSNSAYQYFQGSGHGSYTVTYQRSLATLTTSVQVPGLDTGNTILISGATPSAWDSTWTITQTINSGSLSINQSSVSSGIATFSYSLVSGVAPYAGQSITITNTLNANGALNGANLIIATVSGGDNGTFTILVSTGDFSHVSETGQGVTAGNIFAFDPGAADAGSSTDPIFGNTTVGGSLTFSTISATFVTAGVKQGTCFFITRNGAVTQPANPVTFTVPTNTTAISASLIPIGPPNVLYVGIAFTESGQNEVPGANFYTYDTAVKFTVNGTDYYATALIVPNGTTSAMFSFPDSVLLASDEIDIPGNNYFNLMEIGSPTWMFQYASRMLYGLCQNKINNLVNPTFDGGYISLTNPQPTGWTQAPAVANITSGLVDSPDFGNCLQILNSGESSVTDSYLYYQTAYQDFYKVNILQPNTQYSIRFKARALNADVQTITIALVDYTNSTFGTVYGSYTFSLDQGNFTIQTVEILNSQTAISVNLQLAIQIGSLSAGAGIQIDRMEIFPTSDPVNTTTILTSYSGKFESVDQVTGQLGCAGDNPQPTQGAYEILEQLYIEKTASRCVTQDSPNYEPYNWTVSLASQGVGAIGPNAFHSEEEFSVSVSRSGYFVFDGGKPQPISREMQSTGVSASVWESINWAAAKTIWCRYSTVKREVYIGVPMTTPNFWLPNAPTNSNPTSPNVVIMCNFTGCPTAAELIEGIPVHTTMFGDLKALDMRRKSSLWQMQIPIAEFIMRGDGFSQSLFLGNGNGTSKIYQLADGAALDGQNTDDGAAINWLYTTYGFTKAKQGQQIQGLGALRKIWYYMAVTMEGVGKVAGKLYSNSLGALARNTYTIRLPFTLNYPQQNDQERVLEIGGQRLFVEFSSIGTGGYAEIGSIMLDGEMDKVSPHRGVSS